jgi:hypothetical protein
MAVIVSPGQNEIEQMKKLGLDMVPHRQRMTDSQPPLDEKFKDPADRLRLWPSTAPVEAANRLCGTRRSSLRISEKL